LSNYEVFDTPTSEPPKEQGVFTVIGLSDIELLQVGMVKSPCSFGGSLVGVLKTSSFDKPTV